MTTRYKPGDKVMLKRNAGLTKGGMMIGYDSRSQPYEGTVVTIRSTYEGRMNSYQISEGPSGWYAEDQLTKVKVM
jgi:co-chaperonin GroES (HSP10)